MLTLQTYAVYSPIHISNLLIYHKEKDSFTDLSSAKIFSDIEVMKFDVTTSMVASSCAIHYI